VILLDVGDARSQTVFKICRELKSSNRVQRHLPVILVTSKDTASDRYWGQQQGADGYVTKPFTARRTATRSAQVRMIGHKNKVRATNR